jgi:hypothetical protein
MTPKIFLTAGHRGVDVAGGVRPAEVPGGAGPPSSEDGHWEFDAFRSMEDIISPAHPDVNHPVKPGVFVSCQAQRSFLSCDA